MKGCVLYSNAQSKDFCCINRRQIELCLNPDSVFTLPHCYPGLEILKRELMYRFHSMQIWLIFLPKGQGQNWFHTFTRNAFYWRQRHCGWMLNRFKSAAKSFSLIINIWLPLSMLFQYKKVIGKARPLTHGCLWHWVPLSTKQASAAYHRPCSLYYY